MYIKTVFLLFSDFVIFLNDFLFSENCFICDNASHFSPTLIRFDDKIKTSRHACAVHQNMHYCGDQVCLEDKCPSSVNVERSHQNSIRPLRRKSVASAPLPAAGSGSFSTISKVKYSFINIYCQFRSFPV